MSYFLGNTVLTNVAKPAIPATVTGADNGLSLNGTIVELGGDLIKSTIVNVKDFELFIESDENYLIYLNETYSEIGAYDKSYSNGFVFMFDISIPGQSTAQLLNVIDTPTDPPLFGMSFFQNTDGTNRVLIIGTQAQIIHGTPIPGGFQYIYMTDSLFVIANNELDRELLKWDQVASTIRLGDVHQSYISIELSQISLISDKVVFLGLGSDLLLDVDINGIQTNPTIGGAGRWKLGKKTSGAVSLDTANYIDVEIDGVAVKLAIVT